MPALPHCEGGKLQSHTKDSGMPVVLIVFFVSALLFRIGTLVISIWHERCLKNNGAIEYGATNSSALAFSHLLFYFFAALEGSMRRNSPDLLTWSGFVLYVLSAAFLVAVMHLLGRVWTVKLLIARDHVLVDYGLFRIVKHPNYFLNILPELIGLALGLHAYFTLVIGLPLYLIPLSIRIREEERIMRLRFQNYS
jgi:isoprenylcysteine carboxyl methyltransferase (ICMT) family protein YpbQ